MPLSEYEQRVLDQMERSLASDDPKLASTLQSKSRQTGRILLGLLVIAAGLGMLVGGVAASMPPLGIAGFLIMLVGGYLSLSKPKKPKGETPAAAARPAPPRPRKRRPGFMSRLEERWERRRREGDF